jgi:hypothetical protein
MTDYCISCKHCHTKVVKTHKCRLNAVERLTSSTCCWDSKKYPGMYEPHLPTTTNILTERQQTLMEVVQKVRHLIREEGYDCGEAERILTFLKEMK